MIIMLQLVVLHVLLSIRTDFSGTNEAVNPKKWRTAIVGHGVRWEGPVTDGKFNFSFLFFPCTQRTSPGKTSEAVVAVIFVTGAANDTA